MADNKLTVLQKSYTHLETLLKAKAAALPKDFNQTRFLQNCMTVLQETRDIDKMHPVSIARTMLKGAFLGLDFFNRECYAIPYGNQLQFQTDYKGEIKLAKKYSIRPIKDVYAKLVREGDKFEERVIDGRQSVNFEPVPFNNGEIVGAFAVAYYADDTMIYDTMSKAEIETVRDNFSKAKNSPAWAKTPGEMYKKTILRRLLKLVEKDFDSAEQRKAYDEAADVEFDKEKPVEVSPFDGIVVDAEFEEKQEEPEDKPKTKPAKDNPCEPKLELGSK